MADKNHGIPKSQIRMVEIKDDLLAVIGPTVMAPVVGSFLATYRSGSSVGETIVELVRAVEMVVHTEELSWRLDWEHCTVCITKPKKDRRHDGGIKINVISGPGA